MSWNPALDPDPPKGDAVSSIDSVNLPRDLGGFEVRRAPPAPKRRMGGAFIFFDQIGPVEFPSTRGLDIRPHPHIGLAMISDRFRGRMHRRDSLGADAVLAPGAAIPLPDGQEDRGVYGVDGEVSVAREPYAAGRTRVSRPGERISMTAGPRGARVMLPGGETLEGPRRIWWNFVASSKARIKAAKAAWREGDGAHGWFRWPPGDDGEFIPAPAR